MKKDKTVSFVDRENLKRGIISEVAHQECYIKERGVNANPHSVIFEHNDGTKDSLKYVQLTGERFLPKDNIILLFFSQATVTVTGKQLHTLFDDLANQIVSSVKVFQSQIPANDVHPDVALVMDIQVKYHDAKIEQHTDEAKRSDFKQKNKTGNFFTK
ncbi:hypothetical protein ATE84_2924 [Aquimarina sp. MAR_2010_214]|uniref:hypothetical protein n=1 Tax=Aquimarina sp. MAR_2010_214 TaxID=1250026 RepID=UPI000C702DA5|nr:hypothetical protein [Aquimarina sp. MAR_2010_214]PKV50856.1 hypothetical protein ATE84_2924 [Aquimarina sp. MAR_2010_214]